MAVKILWYLTATDGPFPWKPEGLRPVGLDHFQTLAKTIDELGYYGALLSGGFVEPEVLTLIASVIPSTRRVRFIAPVQAHLQSPTRLAQVAQTIDHFSGGRLALGTSDGNKANRAIYGLPGDADNDRQALNLDYWKAFRAAYLGLADAYEGSHYRLAPVPGGSSNPVSGGGFRPTQTNGVPLWSFAHGLDDDAAAVELFDVYLSFADLPAKLGDKFRRVSAEAQRQNKTLRFGTRFQVIVRETEEEAWDYAQHLLDNTSLDHARESIRRQLPPGETLESYRSPDPQVQRNIDAIRAGRLPRARDFEIYPNLWTGPSLRGFNIVAPGSGTTLIGSAENVAARIREFEEQGSHAFILSGFPSIEESRRVAELLFPRLELDHGFDSLSS